MTNDKKLDKLVKVLGKESAADLEALTVDMLGVSCVGDDGTVSELEANEKYVELKASLDALTAGKKDLDKCQKAVIKYCLYLLSAKGAE